MRATPNSKIIETWKKLKEMTDAGWEPTLSISESGSYYYCELDDEYAGLGNTLETAISNCHKAWIKEV